MSQIFITSDFHFGHDKDFIYEPRGFSSVQEMNESLVAQYNSLVSDNDDIYILGDCLMGDSLINFKYLHALNGKKHIILGNHDTEKRQDLYKNLPNFIEMGHGLPLKYKKYNFFLSHYPNLIDNYDNNKPLKEKVINLCGHSHTQNKFLNFNKGLIYHCEVDAHQNYPVLLDDIIEDIKLYYRKI